MGDVDGATTTNGGLLVFINLEYTLNCFYAENIWCLNCELLEKGDNSIGHLESMGNYKFSAEYELTEKS